MVGLLRRLFGRRERHYISEKSVFDYAVCHCGHYSPWDYDLRKHFEDMGRIGK